MVALNNATAAAGCTARDRQRGSNSELPSRSKARRPRQRTRIAGAIHARRWLFRDELKPDDGPDAGCWTATAYGAALPIGCNSWRNGAD